MNGQRQRKILVEQLIRTLPFEAVVETGTWVGNSTGYLAQLSDLPVHSCELDPRFFALAKSRLAGIPGVHLNREDSRGFLNRLSGTSIVNSFVFFYLDAHWYDDLPLAEELEIIVRRWKRFVIVVDDFQVPQHPGYKFDDYGPGAALDLQTFGKLFASLNLEVFFPKVGPEAETGYLRGCCVLAPRGEIAEKVRMIGSLVRHQDEA